MAAEHFQNKGCLVFEEYPKLSEVYIPSLLELLERMGYFIHICSLRPSRDKNTHRSVKRIRARVTGLGPGYKKFPEEISAFFLLALITPINFSFALWAMLKMLCSMERKLLTLRSFMQACLLVRQVIIAEEMTHIHAHLAPSAARVAYFASVISGIGLSYCAHAKEIYIQDPKVLRLLFRRAQFVHTATDYNRKFIENLCQPGKTKVFALYHGVDLSVFTYSKPQAPAVQPYRITTIADFREKKGLNYVIDALYILKQRGLNFTYTLIGEGPEKKKLQKRIQELGLEENIELSGLMPHRNIIKKMRETDIFVLAPVIARNGDRDALPDSIIESMAIGVPVVASTSGAIPEMIENEETGLLVEPENPEALADACEKLLKDQDLREMTSFKARLKVEGECDNKRQIHKFVSFLEALGLHA
jgi:glycosyltransferase involved in cell wall biosynthesis